MLKRLSSVLAIWAGIVTCAVAFSESPAQPEATSSAAQRVDVPQQAGNPPPAPARTVPPVVEQMLALERHARTGMICYMGPFAPTQLAELNKAAKALAVQVSPPRQRR